MEKFMQMVRDYAASVGKEPSTVIQQATARGERKGLGGTAWKRWESGGSCTVDTMEKIKDFMRKNPPKAAA